LVEILLRPLINGEKDIIHRSEEPSTGSVGFKLIWREGQECRWIVHATASFCPRHVHRLGTKSAMQIGETLRRETRLSTRRVALPIGRGADPTPRVVGCVGVDDVEGRRLESEGREALIQRCCQTKGPQRLVVIASVDEQPVPLFQ
jgi:hypothetical protein